MKQLQRDLNALFGAPRAASNGTPEEERRAHRAAMAKARRLAAKHCVVLDRDADGYWVTHPDFNGGDEDPCQGNHFCVGGVEVLQAVEAYVAKLTAI